MNIKILFSAILLSVNALLFSQNNQDKEYNTKDIQGVWQMRANYTNATDKSFYKLFYIFVGQKMLMIDTSVSPYEELCVTVNDFGFSNYYLNNDISRELVKDKGQYFVQIIKTKDGRELFNASTPFDLTPKQSLFIFNDECYYMEKAPKGVLYVLYKRGFHDNRDYIKEFLDINVCCIKTEKSLICDSIGNNTGGYLIKDNIITVTGEQLGFVKMEYENPQKKIIKGWLRKVDIECIK